MKDRKNWNQPTTDRNGSSNGTVLPNQRLVAPDLARGFMLLLIVLTHAPLLLFGFPDVGIMSRPEAVTNLDRVINFIAHLFVDNRARPMFAVLFGFGLAMILERQLASGNTEKKAKQLLYRRAWLLVLFGFVNSVIIGGQDILAIYGVGGLMIGGLLFRSNRVLEKTIFWMTLFFLVIMPFVWIGFAYSGGISHFPSATDRYVDILLDRLSSFPFIPISHFIIPVLLPIVVGVWMARKNLLTKAQLYRNQLRRIAVVGIAIAVVGGLPLAIVGALSLELSPTVTGLVQAVHIMTGIAGGCAYAALFGLLGIKLKCSTLAIRALVALGKRSLTFYVFNEAMLVVLLSPVALGLGGRLNSTGAAVVAILVWLIAVGFAFLLEKMNMRGPLEVLFRWLLNRKATTGRLAEKQA
ncbi:Uncharacterized membrane protein YeiB [Evansella caseinilytica]|uniref:Uncharacterized membrane protein YeiB n=1 Tax=Evansella caseinilytica TaxID=1503961 RepID=A0A1H3Q3B5_9BACI|nr:DUF418 domain-containing protein [Evansella caseinilytica]SDZ08032.1 Uncharacterized membrane protein YeiB [Evansella caseinilytica]